ncbi:hypothetical protein AALA80_08590 [Oscillospiraceae bacterium 50-60]
MDILFNNSESENPSSPDTKLPNAERRTMEEKCANTNQKLRGTEKWRNLSLNIQIVHALQLRNFQHRFAPALRRNLRYSGNFFAFRRDSLRWTRNRRGRGMWGFDARKSILTAYCNLHRKKDAGKNPALWCWIFAYKIKNSKQLRTIFSQSKN